MYINIEIKARCANADIIWQYLMDQGAVYRGRDEQTDTYFNVPEGRLKLREGNIENNLIFYKRNNQAGPKQSDFSLAKVEDPVELKKMLTNALGLKVVVAKTRDIFYIANVKFHLDTVPGLGHFVEIEAGNLHHPDKSVADLQSQCDFYLHAFGITEADLIAHSYSDLLIGVE
jgi:adenylate cyclase, class 2